MYLYPKLFYRKDRFICSHLIKVISLFNAFDTENSSENFRNQCKNLKNSVFINKFNNILLTYSIKMTKNKRFQCY
jgi:hypothetical protein